MELTLTRPDDWHLHLRDGEVLRDLVPHAAATCARAIVMPNLRPPVTTTAQAAAYRERILASVPDGAEFEPLMTLYLTDLTSPDEIRRAAGSGLVRGVKLYPAGATTNSDAGVTDLERCTPALEAMEEEGIPLLVHGEVTRPSVDIFDREERFLRDVLEPLVGRFAELKIVLEHITTHAAVRFVREAPARVGATITAHHLLCNRNDMLVGGVRPHLFCLPVLKREEDRRSLVAAAVSGDPKFFLGTDSAPHARSTKEHACGCAGCFTGYAPLELYAEAFDRAGALDKLEAFASFHGPDFYGLPRNAAQVTLRRETWTVPGSFRFGDEEVVPLWAGRDLHWKLG